MGFDGARKVTGGESKAALLEKAKDERAKREASRKLSKSALHVQRVWRGWRVRVAARRALRAEWDAEFAPLLTAGQALPAAQVAEKLLPPLLFLLCPHAPQFSEKQPWVLAEPNAADAARVRGVIGLLLGSVGHANPERNYCSLSAKGHEAARRRWVWQCSRLLAVCAHALHTALRATAATAPSWLVPETTTAAQAPKLLVAGASRLVARLCDANQWKCFPAGDAAAALAARQLLHTLLLHPLLMASLHACLLADAGADEPAAGPGSAASTLPLLMQVALRASTLASPAPSRTPSTAPAALAPSQLVAYVLTVDALPRKLSAPLLAQLHAPAVLVPVLTTLGGGPLPPLLRLVGRRPQGSEAAAVLENIMSLVTDSGGGDAAVLDGDVLLAYLAALSSLHGQLSGPRAEAARRSLSQRAHLDALLAAASGRETLIARVLQEYAGMLYDGAGRPAVSMPLLNTCAFHPTLLPMLWAHTAKSLRVPAQIPDQRILLGACHSLPPIRFRSETEEEAAIACVHVASHAGGGVWDMEQLSGGLVGLPKAVGLVMALFCKVYAHLLLVLDDDDFYQRQTPFTLPEQRAIAAALNSILYHTLKSAGVAAESSHRPLVDATAALLQLLYQRDYRRTFCEPSLWLAPAAQEARVAPSAAARAYTVFFGSPSPSAGPSEQAKPGGLDSGVGALLRDAAHMVPFDQRVRIFRELIEQEKTVRGLNRPPIQGGPRAISVTIRRGHECEDAYLQLGVGSRVAGERLKGPLNVGFVNPQGLPEAGVDQGGLLKELISETVRKGVDPQMGLFESTSEGLLYSRPAAEKLPQGLELLELTGRMVGKALYDGVLIDVAFAPFFANKILGHYSYLEDLPNLDATLYKSLCDLKRYEGDASDLCLDFTINDEFLGERTTHELRPGGADIEVTNENKMAYIHLVADWRLNGCMRRVTGAFVGGLAQVINPAWLRLFNPREVNMLLSGGDTDMDIDDLREHTKYSGGFNAESRAVKNLWLVLKEFSKEEKRAFLKFVTSCSRAPLLGFKHLVPQFAVHKVPEQASIFALLGGADVGRLPSASTCYNTLKLPTYKRKSTLREKLRYAISAGAGFELS